MTEQDVTTKQCGGIMLVFVYQLSIIYAMLYQRMLVLPLLLGLIAVGVAELLRNKE